jgi:hypothetical protein
MEIKTIMKNLIAAILLSGIGLPLIAQSGTATLKTSSRLFKDKNDLTSVILIIPKDSVASILGFDDSYLEVDYKGNEGYILSRDARYATAIVTEAPAEKPYTAEASGQVPESAQSSRYAYLKGKYGTAMADRLFARKIWKGMNSGMVTDSWGPAQKITREVAGSIIKEEWLYKTTWLYFENSVLLDWGPVKR